MNSTKKEGLVIKKFSGFYYVQDNSKKIYECRLRGKIKEPVLSGDQVLFTPLDTDKGVLEQIKPRRTQLYRPRVANVSTVLIVMCNDRPAPSLPLLDRLLLLAFYSRIKPCIILNKCDLPATAKALQLKQYYPQAGIDLIETSAAEKKGIESLRMVIKDQIAVLAGPSGAGKSSLLNLLVQGSSMKTQEVSSKIGRGKHTTRHVELFCLESGGWIADTPGFSVLDLPAITSQELDDFFPDFTEYKENCRFRDCLHYKEKDCAIIEAVNQGKITDFRYQNYLDILKEVLANERCYK